MDDLVVQKHGRTWRFPRRGQLELLVFGDSRFRLTRLQRVSCWNISASFGFLRKSVLEVMALEESGDKDLKSAEGGKQLEGLMDTKAIKMPSRCGYGSDRKAT